MGAFDQPTLAADVLMLCYMDDQFLSWNRATKMGLGTKHQVKDMDLCWPAGRVGPSLTC